MKHIQRFIRVSFLFLVCLGAILSIENIHIKAAATNYGILIGSSNGKYTYYDLNGAKGTQRVEKASNGTIMIPLKKVCSYMTHVSYSFNWNTMQATIRNTKNGKRIVLTKNSQYAYTYASKNAKAKKVKLSAKTYISSGSGAAMADLKVLKYVFAKSSGYKLYSKTTKMGKTALTNALYNSSNIKSIIVYNPYKAVTSLPKATAVNYVSEKDLSNIVKVTIPEGYSVAQIADLLVKKGVCQSTQAFLKASNQVKTSSYSCLASATASTKRCFTLEGYLYPSTYEFYKNTSPANVVKTILSNTCKMYTTAYKERAEELGYTMDQVITIASIIEKEVSITKEQPIVGSILYNRLNANMRLQCDATINYVERYIKSYISGDINRYNAYYNTYKCKALPSGPICNPGAKAIQAALYPEESTYLYFCSDKNNTYYYASTYDEHLKNVELIATN